MSDAKSLKSLASGLHVLYVEDEKDIRNEIAEYFRQIFDHVDLAEDGQEGLQLFKENAYDIVITDIQMPYMNGLEMALEMKTINPEQEIIVITAFAEEKYFTDAIRIGITGYIIKPVDRVQMMQILHKTVNKLVRFREHSMYEKKLEAMVEERVTEKIASGYGNFESSLSSLVKMMEECSSLADDDAQRIVLCSKIIAVKTGASEEECERLLKRLSNLL